MATTVSGLAVVEALQKSLVEGVYAGYLPNITSQFSTGKKKGDTAIVPLIKAGTSAAFNATSNNYLGTGAQGSATGVNVLLDQHDFTAMLIAPEVKDRVQVQSIVDSALRQAILRITNTIYAKMLIATYPNTAKVVGLSSAFNYAKFVGLKDEIVARSMNPMMTSVAIQSAYITAAEADPAVYNDMAYRAAVAGGNQTSALISRIAGINTIRTGAVPVGTNIVGALFDDTSMCVAFGNRQPFGEDTAFYQEVVDPNTGFNLAVRQTVSQATGELITGIEAVYGVKEGDTTKLTLLASA